MEDGRNEERRRKGKGGHRGLKRVRGKEGEGWRGKARGGRKEGRGRGWQEGSRAWDVCKEVVRPFRKLQLGQQREASFSSPAPGC